MLANLLAVVGSALSVPWIVVEALFNYPGIGNLLVQAVSLRDVTEVQAIALVLAAIYIGINIVADLVVVLLVPKLRTGMQ